MAHLTLDLVDGIAIVHFANPPLEVMTPQTMNELNAMLPRLREEDVRAVIFTGTSDDIFIRHFSLEELDDLASGKPGEPWDANMDDILLELGELPKPVIAALNGSAAGGGFEFALACDMRVAKDGPYRFGLPEISVGILPGAGGTQRLTEIVGRGRALEMMLRARLLSPSEADKLGIFEELVPEDGTESALDRAIAIAREIAARSPLAVAHIKTLAREAGTPVAKEILTRESVLFMELMQTKEAQALMAHAAETHRAARADPDTVNPDQWMEQQDKDERA